MRLLVPEFLPDGICYLYIPVLNRPSLFEKCMGEKSDTEISGCVTVTYKMVGHIMTLNLSQVLYLMSRSSCVLFM